MAKIARNKKYVKLDDVRISYRAHDDSIHLSSGDPDFPTGFHLPLSKGTAVEGKLRDLLKEFGLIDEAVEDFHDSLPRHAEMREEYFTDAKVPPHFFPIGVGLKSDVIVEDPVTNENVPLVGFSTYSATHTGKDVESVVAPHVLIAGSAGGGKSIIERNIILGALLRPNQWEVLLIDLSKVEFSPWRKYRNVLGVATTMDDALASLKVAHDRMNERYKRLEELGKNHYLDLPDDNKALLLMIDEIALVLHKEGVKTEAGLERDRQADEALNIIADITRLGRAAGVHLVLATQRPDHSLLPGEVKSNFGVRIQCGKATKTASQLLLNSDHGTEVRNNPRGRIYIQVYGRGKHAQVLFPMPDWLDEKLSSVAGERTDFADVLWELQEENKG